MPLTTIEKVGIGAGVVVVLIVIYLVVKSPATPVASTTLPGGAPLPPNISPVSQQGQQINYLATYMNAWAPLLPNLSLADLNTLYTYISQETAFTHGGGTQPTNALFTQAAAIAHKYGLQIQGTDFD